MTTIRQQVSIIDALKGTAGAQVNLPTVFSAPIRTDVVQITHRDMAKNKRQAYAVEEWAGHQTSAISWGTGRAVARIPRVSGGGTSRSGQGAFGNMCRGGRMFAPNKTWRRWHRHINVNQKRYATCSALAASAVPALVMARGHHINAVKEVPCVVSDHAQTFSKTSQAVEFLKRIGAYADVEKVIRSKSRRAGKGKMRGRGTRQRRGPLVVFNEDQGLTKGLRNLPGVELAQVDRLNLLQLAPGAHVGRFVVFTESAFKKLDDIYGTYREGSKTKTNYHLPRPIITNPNINRIINSDEIQSRLRAAKANPRRSSMKKNPLRNLGVLLKLNPAAKDHIRNELLSQKRNKALKAKKVKPTKEKAKERLARQKASRAFGKTLHAAE